jgi:predicted Zn-dependent peptidase
MDAMLEHSITKLKNGLTVLKVPMPGVASVTVLALCNTGSRFETPREEGIAHFFEHMVFKGTEKYPTAQILASTIDSIGAEFNAFTSKEYTGYYVKAAGRHVDLALDVVSDMLLQPALRQEDIDREKGVIIEEINMYEDLPMRKVENVFEQMIFRGSSLGHDILGSKTTVNQLTTANFKKFLKQWYGLGNLVLILAGDPTVVSAKRTTALVTAAFSKPTGARASGKYTVQSALSKKGPWAPHKLHVEYKKTEQAHLILGWPALKRTDERRHILSLASVILGGNMSSRLFTEVREQRGLCYYVRSNIDYFHESGVFGASAGVAPKRIFEAIEVIKQEFSAVATATRLFTDRELANAKEYLIGSMILDFEDSRSVAQYYGFKELLQNEVEDPDAVIARIKATTLDEVNAIMAELIIPSEMRLAVVGPYKSDKDFKQFVG